jgi:hypothetical protein
MTETTTISQRTDLRTLDAHASWREVYHALNVPVSIEPEDSA